MNRRTVLTLPLACALPAPSGENLLDRMITIPSDGDPAIRWQPPVIKIWTGRAPEEAWMAVQAALESLKENSVYVLPSGAEVRMLGG